MVKKGDTLIEVTLAIGIFSMVAVSIVAVMSGGAATAQTSLETTLAREEVDAQAEALRFIHNSAVAEKTAESQPFYLLWQEITKLAFDELPTSEMTYAPATCSELYGTDTDIYKNMFVINYKGFYEFIEKVEENKGQTTVRLSDTLLNEVLITNTNEDTSGVLKQTSTYPRLLYGKDSASTENEKLVENPDTNLLNAEGIYVIAVKSKSGGTPEYYDFYIRSCWYGIDADRPSTVSTIVRLYNPDAVSN